MSTEKPPVAPRWRTIKHPVTGRPITYAVLVRGGRRVVLIKR